MLSPLALAYVGDSVHDLFVRSRAAMSGGNVNELHKECVSLVCCEAQAESLARVLDILTEDEQAIVKRARNSHAKHGAPHAASPADYSKATALEALLGYLYLTGQNERLNQILNLTQGAGQSPAQAADKSSFHCEERATEAVAPT
jgi:ribonuclease-3 family protein